MKMCVLEKQILEKASKMPIGYLDECRSFATITNDGRWCFSFADYQALRAKYAKYSVSEADPYRERISGCCDRADQY